MSNSRKVTSRSARVAVVPSEPTLKQYGLTEGLWRKILDNQGGVCAICKQLPKTGRLVTDHEHVKGWKKMPPEERVKYVRGLLCWVCNHYYCGRGITIAKSKNLTAYLEGYDNGKVHRLG